MQLQLVYQNLQPAASMSQSVYEPASVWLTPTVRQQLLQ
jgi:hypothetical protein